MLFSFTDLTSNWFSSSTNSAFQISFLPLPPLTASACLPSSFLICYKSSNFLVSFLIPKLFKNSYSPLQFFFLLINSFCYLFIDFYSICTFLLWSANVKCKKIARHNQMSGFQKTESNRWKDKGKKFLDKSHSRYTFRSAANIRFSYFDNLCHSLHWGIFFL